MAANRAAALAFVALAALLATVLLAPAAQAHAVWMSSSPGRGERLAQAPTEAWVRFTEPVEESGTFVHVHDATDRRVDLGDVRFEHGANPVVRVSLPPGLPEGSYLVRYQTLSGADGHTRPGSFGFAVGPHDPLAADDAPGTVPWGIAAARLVAAAGVALGLGAALFLSWVAPVAPLPRPVVVRALLAGAAVHVVGALGLVLATAREAGLGVAALLETGVGGSLALRLAFGIVALAFAAIAALPRMPAKAPPHVAALALAAAAVAGARVAHAAAAGISGVVTDAIHVVAATAWLGGLVVFLAVLRRAAAGGLDGDHVRLAGVRFGTAALGCVIALAASGFATSLAIVGPQAAADPAAALGSPWGRLLAAKVGLTLLMLAVAAVNRYIVLEPPTTQGLAGRMQRLAGARGASLRGLDAGAPGLRRLLRVEALAGAVTLVLAALLASVSPPAAGAGPATDAFTTGASGEEFHGDLTASPAPVQGGSSVLTLRLATHAEEAVRGNTCGREGSSCVRATIAVGGSGGEAHEFTPDGDGTWRTGEVLWAQAGNATVHVRVQTADVYEDVLVFVLPVKAAST